MSKNHSFWGNLSPLGGLMGVGLIIMATSRLSWAIIVSGALFWVYGLTILSFSFLSSPMFAKIFPVTGSRYVFTCLASFFACIYLLFFMFLCPLAAFEVFLPLLLVPLFCSVSGLDTAVLSSKEKSNHDIFDNVSEAISKAASIAVLLIIFSIVREPFAYCSLSFPGTYHGMVIIMYFREGAFFPIGIFASSAGALLLLAYLVSLYQYSRNSIFPEKKLESREQHE